MSSNNVFAALLDTYDSYAAKGVLPPISHAIRGAQVEIVIDMDGKFISAVQLEKSEGRTIIPVTTDSASRTSGTAPHPLCDTLQYLAGYALGAQKRYDAYILQLEEWVAKSPHSYTEAVYQYISGRTILSDLIASGVLETDDSGALSKKKMQNNVKQSGAFVRFCVRDGEKVIPLHKCRELAENWADYYDSTLDDIITCHITGQQMPLARIHPSGIRYQGDAARLFFKDGAPIGYNTSQKIHIALKWLISELGIYVGDQFFVVWSDDGRPIPDFFEGSGPLLGYPETAELYETNLAALLADESERIKGAKIHALSLKAPTKGRLSVSYFQTLSAEEYLNALEHWFFWCAGPLHYLHQDQETKTFKAIPYIGSPGIDFLSKAISPSNRAYSNQLGSTFLRFIHCFFEQSPPPADIARAITRYNSRAYNMDNNLRYKEEASIIQRLRQHDLTGAEHGLGGLSYARYCAQK